jgi:hypothetical protein
MSFPKVHTRYPEQDQFCIHMAELMKTFRENKLVNGILRMKTRDNFCPILQCKICKIENQCTEIWLQFISEEEMKEELEI